MKNAYIKLHDINLDYPSSPYNATTIKEFFFNIVRKIITKGLLEMYMH